MRHENTSRPDKCYFGAFVREQIKTHSVAKVSVAVTLRYEAGVGGGQPDDVYKVHCTFLHLHESRTSCPKPVTDQQSATAGISVVQSDLV